MSCIIRIQEARLVLTDTEHEIANYILDNPAQITNISAQKLAELTKTSPAAIIRFAKKIEFEGFPQLKIELAKDLSNESVEFDNLLDPNEDINSLMKKVYQSHMITLEKTYGLMNSTIIEQIIQEIVQCNNVFLFGLTGSGTVCEDFQQKLIRIGKGAIYYHDTHLQLTAVPNMNSNDLAFFISYSGKTKEIVTAAKWTKKLKIKSVAITQSQHNELGKLVDYVIAIPSEEKELRIGATSSRLSSLMIVDLLYYGVARLNKEQTHQRIVETRQIIEEIQK